MSRVEESPAAAAERVNTNKTETSAESISSGNYSDHDNKQPKQQPTVSTTSISTSSEKEKSSPSLASSEEKVEAHKPEKPTNDIQNKPELTQHTPEPSSSSSSPAAVAGPMSTSIVMVDLERDEDGGAEPIMNSHANLAEQETYDTTTTDHATATEPSPTLVVPYDLKQIEDITEATSRVVSSDEEEEEEEETAVVVRQVAYDVVVNRQNERTNIIRTLSCKIGSSCYDLYAD